MKCKIGQGKSEEKGEFGSLWNGFAKLKGGTPILLRPQDPFGKQVVYKTNYQMFPKSNKHFFQCK